MTLERIWTRTDLPPQLRLALDEAIAKQARGPAALRITDVAGYSDWALLLSARSDRQVRAIAEAVEQALSAQGRKPIGSDGKSDYHWVLLDYDDFIVHVFYHPVRTYYDLESMWHDAPRADLELAADVADVSELSGLIPPEPMPEFRGSAEFGGFADEFEDMADIEPQRLAEAEAAAWGTLIAPGSTEPGSTEPGSTEPTATEPPATESDDELFGE
ncbi:MAG: ribosome silencing factor [Nannocystaceae bacterium]